MSTPVRWKKGDSCVHSKDVYGCTGVALLRPSKPGQSVLSFHVEALEAVHIYVVPNIRADSRSSIDLCSFVLFCECA